MKKIRITFVFACLLFCSMSVKADTVYKTKKVLFQNVNVMSGAGVELDFTSAENDYSYISANDYLKVVEPVGFEVYRADSVDGEYVLIGTQNVPDGTVNFKYTDTGIMEGNTYYYKVRFLANSIHDVFVVNEDAKRDYENGLHDESYYDNLYIKWDGEWGDWEECVETFAGDFSDPLKVVAVQSPGKIKYVRSVKAKTFKIKWDLVSGIDGYNLYVKEFDNKYLYGMHKYSQYETEGCSEGDNESWNDKYFEEVDKIPFKKVASISANNDSYTYKNATHGNGYIFMLKTYKNINGVPVESVVSYAAHGVMDYYFCPNAENSKFLYKWPKTQKKASKMCKTISVKMWDFKNHASHKGPKRTRIQYITVNKKYAETIKEIYKEIYKSKSKPPIYEAGSYRWREGDLGSYHTVGTAIDMNCNENPMYTYKGNKKVVAVGKFYKPKSNPYSMPRNGVIENTFAKYGFIRLSHDLMHFNADYVNESSNYDVKWGDWY